jgi:branched-chain amino acid transport system permease protein
MTLFVIFAAVPFATEAIGEGYLASLAIRIMIMAIAALGLDLILGYGALVSFGHAAFVGIGAYAIGISAAHGLTEGFVTFPLAILAAGLFALVTGAISLRTRGVYFIMITLAFGQMAYFTAVSLSAYGGDDGLTVWSRSEFLGASVFESGNSFYFAVLGCLSAVFLLCRAIVGSRFGRVLQGGAPEPVTRAGDRLQSIRLSARSLCHRRHDRGPGRRTACQPHGIRQPGFHVLAPFGRAYRHGGARRHGARSPVR